MRYPRQPAAACAWIHFWRLGLHSLLATHLHLTLTNCGVFLKQAAAPAQLGSPTSAASTPMLELAAASGGAGVVQKAALHVSAGSL